jgi:hypothetical protein
VDAIDAAAKLAKYHELAFHELSLFLFTRDRAFFDASARPLVAARMRKSVVDHFLLSQPTQAAPADNVQRLLVDQRIASIAALRVAAASAELNKLNLLEQSRSPSPTPSSWRAARRSSD